MVPLEGSGCSLCCEDGRCQFEVGGHGAAWELDRPCDEDMGAAAEGRGPALRRAWCWVQREGSSAAFGEGIKWCIEKQFD